MKKALTRRSTCIGKTQIPEQLFRPGTGSDDQASGPKRAAIRFHSDSVPIRRPAEHFLPEPDRCAKLLRQRHVGDDAGLAADVADVRFVERGHTVVEAESGETFGQVPFAQDDSEPAFDGAIRPRRGNPDCHLRGATRPRR